MSYSMTADGGPDDLPRTLRRERDAREREARERMEAERAQAAREALPMGAPAAHQPAMAAQPHPMPPHPHAASAEEFYAVPDPAYVATPDAAMPATVTRFDVPFLHLVAFFLKAALAAFPAIILLGVIVWFAGHLLQIYFPWLVKAQILIHFPN